MRRRDWIVGSYSSVDLIIQKISPPRHRGELAIAGAIDSNEIRGNDGQTMDEHYVFHNSRGGSCGRDPRCLFFGTGCEGRTLLRSERLAAKPAQDHLKKHNKAPVLLYRV